MNLFIFSPDLALFAISPGQTVFMGVFLLTMIGLLLLPGRMLGQEGARPVWWKNVRVWASAICVVQIAVYWIWG